MQTQDCKRENMGRWAAGIPCVSGSGDKIEDPRLKNRERCSVDGELLKCLKHESQVTGMMVVRAHCDRPMRLCPDTPSEVVITWSWGVLSAPVGLPELR